MKPPRARGSTNRAASNDYADQFVDDFIVARDGDESCSSRGLSDTGKQQQQQFPRSTSFTWAKLKDRVSSRGAFTTAPPKNARSVISDSELSNLGETDNIFFEEAGHESSNIVFMHDSDADLPEGMLLPSDSSDQDITTDRRLIEQSRSVRSLQEWVAKVIATDDIDEIRRLDELRGIGAEDMSWVHRCVRVKRISRFYLIVICAVFLFIVGAALGVAKAVSKQGLPSEGTNKTANDARFEMPSTAPSNFLDDEFDKLGTGTEAAWDPLPTDWKDGISSSPYHGGGNDFQQSVTISENGLLVASVVNRKLIFFMYEGVLWKEVRGPDLDGDVLNVSLNGDGTRLAIACISKVENNTAHVQVLDFDGSVWIRVGQEVPFSLTQVISIALSSDGHALLVGWTGDESSRGSAVVMRYNGDSGWWLPEGEMLQGDTESDFFGMSVSINYDGTLIAVGIPGKSVNGNNGAGAVRVFRYSEAKWVQVGEDFNGRHSDEQFGYSVSLTPGGARLAVGVSYVVETSYVFEVSGYSWAQLGSPIEQNQTGGSKIAVALSGDGNTLALGGANQCRVYSFEGAAWILIGQFSGNTDRFGESVALNAEGDRVVIGGGHIEGDSYIRIVDYTAKKAVRA